MNDWFTIDKIDNATYIISEYRHWEETHSYLLIGENRSLLIDTGLGIRNISDVVAELTDKPVVAIATHIHWDHIGGHKYYPDFYAHAAELNWLKGEFPLSMETVRNMVLEKCDMPKDFSIEKYELFQGLPSKILRGGELIDLGGRTVQVLHTPGHSPGHMCFWEDSRKYLYTGDLIYKDTLFAYYPSTDPQAYLTSLKAIAKLEAERILPAHHTLEIYPEIVVRMKDALNDLNKSGKLCHGSGLFDYGDWAIRL
jgi:glyoxylase-like metal-dependent hydrolase (beta-lactamase superfamily II)